MTLEIKADVLENVKTRLYAKTKSWNGGVCQGFTADIETGKTIHDGHTACHSWVGYTYNSTSGTGKWVYQVGTWDNNFEPTAKNFLVATCHSRSRSKASEEATDAIILWMASDESPFSRFIVNRDDPKSLTEGGAIILCGPDGATQSQAMWMCKVLRYTTEGSKALDTWLTLYKGGVSPLLAVLVSSYISDIKGATFTAASVSGHVAVFNGINYREGTVKEDVAHGLLNAEMNLSAKNTMSVFESKKADANKKRTAVETRITGFCKPIKKSDGWGGEIRGNGATGAELVAAVLKWQEELGGYTPGNFRSDLLRVAEPTPDAPLPTSNTVYLELDL